MTTEIEQFEAAESERLAALIPLERGRCHVDADELAECPWCRRPAELWAPDWRPAATPWFVSCPGAPCPVAPITKFFATRAEAVDAWNYGLSVSADEEVSNADPE